MTPNSPEEAVGDFYEFPPKCYVCEDELSEEMKSKCYIRYDNQTQSWQLVCVEHADEHSHLVEVEYGEVEIAKGIEEKMMKIVGVVDS